MDPHVDIQIKGITDRNTREFRASVSGVPNLVDSLSGSEYMITYMTITWSWYSTGETFRYIALRSHKILKSGDVSATSRTHFMSGELPEWLAKIAENHAPAGYRQAVQESRQGSHSGDGPNGDHGAR